MELDDELCLCFHVTRRKVINYLRIEKPKKATQLSDCFGAGSGCGWCRPFLEQLFEHAQTDNPEDLALPTADEFGISRTQYVQQGGGTPPAGATPING
jgi:NAD(P)H-nitrite reductase large subunit